MKHYDGQEPEVKGWNEILNELGLKMSTFNLLENHKVDLQIKEKIFLSAWPLFLNI